MQFTGVFPRCGRVGYGVDVLRLTVCLVVGPVAFSGFTFIFGCASVGGASDCGVSGLGACLLVGWWRPCALAVCPAAGVFLLDFFCFSVGFCLLLGTYLCFISFLCFDLCVLGDGALIS